MKKLFFGLVLSLFSCAGCTKSVTSHPCSGTDCTPVAVQPAPLPVVNTPDAGVTPKVVPVPEVPTQSATKKLSGDTWSVEVPTEWDVLDVDVEGGLLFAYVNRAEKNLFFMGQEEFNGNLDLYTLYSVASVQSAGGIVSTVEKTDINGNHYSVLHAVNESELATLWLWVTVSGGYGYVFSCGGNLATADEQFKICSSIANTLNIK